jgi:hypothetical protein
MGRSAVAANPAARRTSEDDVSTAPRQYSRLRGTTGERAAVGEVLAVQDGKAIWKLHPSYAAWLWPLMSKATELSLYIPEALLEPMQDGDSTVPPRAPTEQEKDEILREPEQIADAVQVYSLALKGKYPSVRKAFPTRTVTLGAIRYCRSRIKI